jgi:hypothetical protein
MGAVFFVITVAAILAVLLVLAVSAVVASAGIVVLLGEGSGGRSGFSDNLFPAYPKFYICMSKFNFFTNFSDR